MLELGIDEATLVLQLPKAKKAAIESADWLDTAKGLIGVFEDKSDFVRVFGTRHRMNNKPAGYTNAYRYGNHLFYLAVAFNDWIVDMGIIVKFSAQALAYYLQEANMQLYDFLQLIRCDSYDIRLSRVDFTADYIDEGIDTTAIYRGVTNSELVVLHECLNKRTGEIKYRKARMSLRGFAAEDKIPTLYLGSPKSNAQLRVYDKRSEQIERKGAQYDKALACENWVRFEGVFRNEYAHQLTDVLLRVSSNAELKSLIAATIVQKFRFVRVMDDALSVDTDYTKMLLRAANGLCAVLHAPTSRTFDIVRSLQYVFLNSGMMPTLYKVKEIWGTDALHELTKYIDALTFEWKPNSDCRSWLASNKEDTFRSHHDFVEMFDSYIKPLVQSANNRNTEANT